MISVLTIQKKTEAQDIDQTLFRPRRPTEEDSPQGISRQLKYPAALAFLYTVFYSKNQSTFAQGIPIGAFLFHIVLAASSEAKS